MVKFYDYWKGQDSTEPSAAEGTSGANMACSMNGYKALVEDILRLSLTAITLYNGIIEQTLAAMTLTYLAKSYDLLYSFLLGASGWVAYVIAAAYYFGLEFGYGEYLCTASQYGYMVVYYLNIVVSLGASAE